MLATRLTAIALLVALAAGCQMASSSGPPDPPPTPAPEVPIDFATRSILIVAEDAFYRQGSPIVTDVGDGVSVVYPYQGSVGLAEPAGYVVNRRTLFDLPHVPDGTTVRVTTFRSN